MTIFKIFLKGIFAVVFIVGFTFLLAGRWDYWQGWLFSGVMIAFMVISIYLFRNKLDLAKERMSPGPGVKGWDKVLFSGFTIFLYSAWIIGALDTGRFGWTTDFPVWGYILSYAIFIFSVFMFTWPMLVNKWFSSMVRIQKDRGQQVCQEGPYKYIRHPGYVGGILMALSMGLVFGSLWTLVPGAAAAVLLIIRTYLEDETLKKELPGYMEYAEKVKYRLVPGLW